MDALSYLFVGGGAAGLIAAISISLSKERRNTIAEADKVMAARFGLIDSYLRPDTACIGISWERRTLILGDTPKTAVEYPLDSVRGVSIEVDRVNVTTSKSKTRGNGGSRLLGAAAGAALAGPVGLVLGAGGSKTTTKGKAVEKQHIRQISLVVRLSDQSNPLREFCFLKTYGPGFSETSVQSELKRAEHYRALLLNAVEERGASHLAQGATDRFSQLESSKHKA